MEFLEQMKEKVKEIEQMIEQFLPKEEGYQQLIFEAMNYSVRAGGKRLRPMLMLETYRLFGGEEKVIEPYMAAIEMIHTYSLVHDDLPAMDDDLYRRGKKTTHAVYGEAIVLVVSGRFASEREVRALCNQKLPSYEIPTHIKLRPQLTYTASGKLIRTKE